MAADLQKTFGVNAELIESYGGIFEVEKDGELIYSKKALGRFPEPGEVINIINEAEKRVKT